MPVTEGSSTCVPRSVLTRNVVVGSIMAVLMGPSLVCIGAAEGQRSDLYRILVGSCPKGCRIGYIDVRGNVVIAPVFGEGSREFSDGLALVTVRAENEWMTAYIDSSGAYVIRPRQFEEAENFYESRARVRVNGRIGYLDKSGAFAIPPRFEDGTSFQDGLAAVRVEEKWFFVNTRGDVAFPLTVDQAFPFSEGLAAVEVGGKAGYVDRNGRMVIEAQYDRAHAFAEGLATVIIDGRWGAIDGGGRVVVEPRYDWLSPCSNGVICYSRNGVIGYIDRYGQDMFGGRTFKHAMGFNDGLAPVQVDSRYGYIDPTGRPGHTGGLR